MAILPVVLHSVIIVKPQGVLLFFWCLLLGTFPCLEWILMSTRI
ncbi:hypothetical protein SLEP1_g37284 [Rubroshorea leprosula]|uniref:NADH dehydrogenase subunit 4 n=1 Tax=Rubroshorea leprosula TaxID=152421 RepID=A0AAV5KUF1_9ROSI|nr:hypothetical protein SLEP1_g37284 [Rubroshorea leprosula]